MPAAIGRDSVALIARAVEDSTQHLTQETMARLGEPSQWLFFGVYVMLAVIGLMTWLAARNSARSAMLSANAAASSSEIARQSLEWIRDDERRRRIAAQDYATWQVCYRGLSALRNWVEWGLTEILKLKNENRERYWNEWVGPLMIFNTRPHFADPKCETAWQEAMIELGPVLAEVRRKGGGLGPDQVIESGPPPPLDDLGRVEEKLMAVFSEVYGATNPRALGFEDWKTLRVESRQP